MGRRLKLRVLKAGDGLLTLRSVGEGSGVGTARLRAVRGHAVLLGAVAGVFSDDVDA